MELRHLRYFIAVAEEENVTRAAGRLHVSQPALSRQIRDLEEEIGFPLLERSAKSVHLTEAGRVFLGEARAVMERTQQAVATAKAAAEGEDEDIHVGYAPSLTVEILPGALRFCQQAHPHTRIRLHDLSTEEMLQGLREKKLHAALIVKLPARMMSGVVFEELRRYPICVALPLNHRLAKLKTVPLEKILNEPLLGYTQKDYPEYHDLLTETFGKSGRGVRLAEEHDTATSLIASVESGSGVALVHRGFECLSGQRLKIRPITPAPAPLVVGIALPGGPLARPGRKFLAAVRQVRDDQ